VQDPNRPAKPTMAPLILPATMDVTQAPTNDAIWDWDLLTQTISWNQAVQALFKFAETEVHTDIHWWTEQIHPEDVDRVVASVKGTLDNKEHYWSAEYRFRCGDGSWVVVMDRGFVVYNELHEPVRIVGSMLNLTEQRKSEAILKKSYEREHLLRRIVEMISQSFDPETILHFTVQELARFFGVDRIGVTFLSDATHAPPNTLVERMFCFDQNLSVPDIQILDRPGAFFNQIPPAAIFNTAPSVLGTYPKPSTFPDFFKDYAHTYGIQSALVLSIHYRGVLFGEVGLYQIQASRIWTEDELSLLEAVMTHVGVAMYQAELFQQEQHARQEAELANQRKSQFLATMSHELRTPLTAVIGYADMLYANAQLSEEKRHRYAYNIVQSGQHLLDIVNDVLDMAKIEAGKIKLNPERIYLPDFLHAIQSMMQELAKDKDVTLTCQVSPELTTWTADPLRLKQILINLIGNAIKFNRPHGTVDVTLKASSDEKWLLGQVADTGIGIPKNQLTQLFQEFYQVDNSLSRRYEGTGLGLALTKKLLALHSGTIEATSVENQGSVFTFRLPATLPAES